MDQLRRLPQLPPQTLALNAALATALLGTAIWCVQDYQAFLALGPGGVPYNLKGWAFVTMLRPLGLSKRGVVQVTDYPIDGTHEEIKALPDRSGARAAVGGIIPHRQLSQHPPEEMNQPITNLFKSALSLNSDILEEKLSLYEQHNPALFVHHNILSRADPAVPETAHIGRGEVGHVHRDYSLHLYLSPADARQVITKGWGERHPLSKPDSSIFQFKNKHLADTYLMIYGPRNEEELETVSKILQSSIRFMTGRNDVKVPRWNMAQDSN